MSLAKDATKLTKLDRVRRSTITGLAGLALGLSVTDTIPVWAAAAVTVMAILGIASEVRSDNRAERAFAEGVVTGYAKASAEAGEVK